MTESIADTLLKYKTDIDKAKTDKARTEGSLIELMKSLKKDFGVSSLSDAETLLKEKQQKIKKMEDELNTGVAKLKEKY